MDPQQLNTKDANLKKNGQFLAKDADLKTGFKFSYNMNKPNTYENSSQDKNYFIEQFEANSKENKLKYVGKYLCNMAHELGTGPFSKIYLGEDVETKQKYAMKTISMDIITKIPELEESIKQESLTMKSLKHKNLVDYYDILYSQNHYYFIMEYCSGGNLATYLKSQGRLKESEALSILKQILFAYYELLKIGKTHLSINPRKCLIYENIYKLSDFGLSRCFEKYLLRDPYKPMSDSTLYMSPQTIKHCYSNKSDLWSIAVTYYEMLFGTLPWKAQTESELLKNMMSQPLLFPPDVEITQASKFFLSEALKIDENARISWKDVFLHPLFNECFNYRNKLIFLMNQEIHYRNILNETFLRNQMDINNIFSLIDKRNKYELDLKRFVGFMRQIDYKISFEECEYIFNEIDDIRRKSIDIHTFVKWLSTSNTISLKRIESMQPQKISPIKHQKNPSLQNFYEEKHVQIREEHAQKSGNKMENINTPVKGGFVQVQAQYYKNTPKKLNTSPSPPSGGSENKNNIALIIAEINCYIEKNQGNFDKIFDLIKDNQPEINIEQFENLMNLMNISQFSEKDMTTVFSKFDKNSDGKISLYDIMIKD